MNEPNRVYLDWAAATPLSPVAKEAMEPYLDAVYGNPSAIHQEGIAARQAVEGARERVARAAQVKSEYVTFTGGGTEANNLVLFGLIEALRQSGRAPGECEVVTTRIEHPSIYLAMHRLEQMGVAVRYVRVDTAGRVDTEDLVAQLNERTVLFSVAYINSEIGTIQPLHALRRRLAAAEAEYGTRILWHLDGAQAPLWCSCQLATVGADFLTLDFTKCRGPKGVGVIVRSKRQHLAPTTFGGGQEAGLRPGTENVAGVVGGSVAFAEAQETWQSTAERTAAVRDGLIERLLDMVPDCQLNGATGTERVANNINISVSGIDTEFAAVVLDRAGYAVSTKSACSGAGGGESVVVREITGDPARAAATLRLTLGPETNAEQVAALPSILATHAQSMRSLTQV